MRTASCRAGVCWAGSEAPLSSSCPHSCTSSERLWTSVCALCVTKAEKAAEIRLPALGVRQGGKNILQPRGADDSLQQLWHVHKTALPPHGGQPRGEALQMGGRLRLGADAGVEVGGLVHCADAGQLLRGKAEDGAGHGGGQRDIAAGIVDDLQQLQEDLDLGGLQQIAARARVAGDAALLQRSLVHARGHAGRAHEDDNIRRARGAQRAVLRYKRAAVQKLRDARGDELGLRAGLVAGIVVRGGQVKAVQLDLGAPLLREARAGDEGFGLRIVELARLSFHDEGKDVVGSLQDPARERKFFDSRSLRGSPGACVPRMG